jgi:hypothetical protein
MENNKLSVTKNSLLSIDKSKTISCSIVGSNASLIASLKSLVTD